MAIFEYLESWYNTKRRHFRLGYLSPNEFERRAAASAKQASGNVRHRGQADLEVFAIDEPEIQNHPPGVPYRQILEETLLPLAVAHLSAGGESPNPSTESGVRQAKLAVSCG